MSEAPRRMTAEEFRSMIHAWHGSPHGAQTALARRLGVDPRTIRRACKTGPSPNLQAAAEELIGLRTEPKPCRSEWIFGDGEDGFEFLVHAWPPRFIARVVYLDEDMEPSADQYHVSEEGMAYTSDWFQICEFTWWDSPPGDITGLMERACDAVERIADETSKA